MSHQIYPHKQLVQLAENLWQIEGSLPLPVPRNMTVWRSPEKKLVLYSVIALDDAGMASLEALGEPALMVVPHRRHQMDVPFYKARYPKIEMGAAKLAAYGIPSETIPGTSYEDLALQLPIDGGHALCVCELLGNLSGVGGAFGAMLKVLGTPGGGFGVARAVKAREVRQAERAKAWMLERAADPALRMVLVGHGAPVLENAANALKNAALNGL